MKKQNQTTARDQSETNVCNRRDREFKVRIISILPGLEKSVDIISETLSKKIKKKKNNLR